ncbi:hypothetical protein MAIT1_02157 [Magnetofaba australis IT-1]|uniref:TRAM domain-containing protein n=2 Tax=Magnetofaba TaxID=1472292 RepID=A0A1Y2K285_9PROT|nr:hypothetical protein MAIT1_02157 [Magnetofaba australis IT-1]
MGQVLGARVQSVNADGSGVMRMADGATLAFTGGAGLRPGEQVRMEVMRLQPEMALKLINSESGSAAKLAQNLEQSLARAPDLFKSLLQAAEAETQSAAVRARGGSASRAAGGRFATLQGQSLASVLKNNLPNLSLNALIKGDAAALAKLFESGNRLQVAESVRALQQAAAQLRGDGVSDVDVAATRASLNRMGDLLAMQELLPRTAQADAQTALLGYRIFWLDEGGLGEAMVWRERERKRQQAQEGGEVTSVLLSLNMLNLGAVQARAALADGWLSVNLRAEEEAALAALRSDVSSLRQGMIDAGLPLQSLDLGRLSWGELQGAREQALGTGAAGFEASA